MFEFTSLFLGNLLGCGSSLVPITSALPGYMTLTSACETCCDIFDGKTNTLSGSSMSCSATSMGTAVTDAVGDAYEATKKQLQVTDAYIESLNEDELTYLIEKLEEKEKILLTKENNKINVNIDNNKAKTLK